MAICIEAISQDQIEVALGCLNVVSPATYADC